MSNKSQIELEAYLIILLPILTLILCLLLLTCKAPGQRTYKRSYGRLYVLPNLYVCLYVLQNSYVRLYVRSSVHLNSYVRLYVLPSLYMCLYVHLYVLQNSYVPFYVHEKNVFMNSRTNKAQRAVTTRKRLCSAGKPWCSYFPVKRRGVHSTPRSDPRASSKPGRMVSVV